MKRKLGVLNSYGFSSSKPAGGGTLGSGYLVRSVYSPWLGSWHFEQRACSLMKIALPSFSTSVSSRCSRGGVARPLRTKVIKYCARETRSFLVTSSWVE